MIWRVILWTILAALCGSLPLAYWIGRSALGVDIRHYGDGNPGAMNVWRAGGRGWFVIALLLEFLKGAIPIWLARAWGGLEGWSLLPPVLAAPLGHAFSPFLGFRGGKAIAVTFGVWSGWTLWQVPLLLGAIFTLLLRLTPPEARAVRNGILVLVLLLALAALLRQVSWALPTAALGHAALLIWKVRSRSELQ